MTVIWYCNGCGRRTGRSTASWRAYGLDRDRNEAAFHFCSQGCKNQWDLGLRDAGEPVPDPSGFA